MLDLGIVLAYFVAIMVAALWGRDRGEVTVEQYFLSSRSLRWPSVALSTIATNIQGYQFLGMMGSAYLFGIAQASLEINAVQGILLAVFVFVPLYMRSRVVTVTQFIAERIGRKAALVYSGANIALFSTITLGAALFWGAYAADLVFGDYLAVISQDRVVRIAVLLVGLGVFSAIYTYLGGLAAVVRTDVVQFGILFLGGFVVLLVAIREVGGWGQLYVRTPELMQLHLPREHPTLPWTHMFGLFLLNINYWCANQSVLQRSLAARSLKDAQVGLMVGGVLKYAMAVLIVVPGVALAGILGAGGLDEPDMAFPYLVTTYLPIGLKGLILSALFASLMSTVDSTYNSLATLWSVDLYKGYFRPAASESQVVQAGRRAILVALVTGCLMGLVLLYLKFEDPGAAFTHTLNELRYYINCGIVVLICTAVLVAVPRERIVLLAFFLTIPLNLFILQAFPAMNYFVRAFWVIVIAFGVIALTTPRRNWVSGGELLTSHSPSVARAGLLLAASLVALHVVFH
ncbi:MAG: sodium/solute symporter [Rhodothermales bacterium]|nr:sodium/solute symporter [Rhodothermales bacterium]MBO6778219.1 sodium/solute symporter [Rhodothermales bacterium]